MFEWYAEGTTEKYEVSVTDISTNTASLKGEFTFYPHTDGFDNHKNMQLGSGNKFKATVTQYSSCVQGEALFWFL